MAKRKSDKGKTMGRMVMGVRKKLIDKDEGIRSVEED